MKLISAFVTLLASAVMVSAAAVETGDVEVELLADIQAMFPEKNWTIVTPEGPDPDTTSLNGRSDVTYLHSWVCSEDRASSDQHGHLRQAHKDFNKLFGNARLVAVKDQIYRSYCRNYSFAVMNRSGTKRTEVSNARNVAVSRSPGKHIQCFTAVREDAWMYYYFAKGNYDIGYPGKKSVRRC